MVRGTLHGIARYTYCLAEGIGRLRPDWTVGLLTNDPEVWNSLRRTHPNLVPVPVGARPFRPAEQWELIAAARAWRPDLVHFPSIAVPLLFPRPFLITVHDLIPYHFSGSRLARFYLRHVFRRVARRAERILCGSYFSAGDIESILGISRIEMIPYGGLDGPASPSGRELAPPVGRPYFLCVTNPKPSKNLRVLLDAFRPLEAEHDLVIVSPNAPWLAEASLGRPSVRRLHGLSDDELRALYKGALAVVTPSLYEGFGLPPLEAMQLGTAVISSNATSLPEVVGQAGLLFDPRRSEELTERMVRVAASSELREELIARGRRQAALFSWEACVLGHLAVYERNRGG